MIAMTVPNNPPTLVEFDLFDEGMTHRHTDRGTHDRMFPHKAILIVVRGPPSNIFENTDN